MEAGRSSSSSGQGKPSRPAPARALTPASAPAPTARGSRPTRARPNQRKRRKIERPDAEPEGPDVDWPLAPSQPASPSPASWPDAAPSSPAPRAQPETQPSPASLTQRDALRVAEEFFSGRGSSDEDGDDEDEGFEPEDGGDAAAGFFLGLFERDAALRGTTSGSTRRGSYGAWGGRGREGAVGEPRPGGSGTAAASCTTRVTPNTTGGRWRTLSATCSAGTSSGCLTGTLWKLLDGKCEGTLEY
ncbi:translation initiation factor IF-2-like [Hordeum vulgare subsp. vulgare]|uniref:translation initiation factor IF-2-like n=1 Tax=Hordeum vulgare subsp. vulgare TaxID=112509 RepID=UPI001D1A4C90|nr:translation initiation factor IF-2-like [Hordeum vulgare subsp. vulgare]